MTKMYRKRLIPDECVLLKDDVIVQRDDDEIITRWQTLHPKPDFSHGTSYYCLKEGWKISIFYKSDNSIAYTYCDIIDTTYDEASDTYVFTDLLADVIIDNNGFVKVVDLDELAEACSLGIISNEMLVRSLHQLNSLLTIIYNGEFKKYLDVIKEV
ncbi:MAG: DUF402 domain-containing protein [Lachnospira sp.]|nr:DUF402 domain-containing protein [Lachnospira sp.]